LVVVSLLQSIQDSALSVWLRQEPLVYPLLEVLHILGFGVLIGTMLAVDLAVWQGRVRDFVDRLLPLSLAGFGIALVAGLAMLAARPLDLLSNSVLWIKLGLIALAGVNAFWFHGRHALSKLDRLARWQAMLSIALWVAVVFAGRWIAYV
jgi:hypothetical protein